MVPRTQASAHGRSSVNSRLAGVPEPSSTHRQLFLQADAERLGVVGFQLLQGHSGLADELIVAEFVLVTHGDPGGEWLPQSVGIHKWQGVPGWGVGTGALTHLRVFRIMSSSVIP